MTLAGLALAIGPLVDLAIVVLENTHRHLGLGARPKEAAFHGASEVAMPTLAATLCTLLVLLPLALIPGLGAFLFKPLFLSVAFAVLIAYAVCAQLCPGPLRGLAQASSPGPTRRDRVPHHRLRHRNAHENRPAKGCWLALFERWEVDDWSGHQRLHPPPGGGIADRA